MRATGTSKKPGEPTPQGRGTMGADGMVGKLSKGRSGSGCDAGSHAKEDISAAALDLVKSQVVGLLPLRKGIGDFPEPRIG